MGNQNIQMNDKLPHYSLIGLWKLHSNIPITLKKVELGCKSWFGMFTAVMLLFYLKFVFFLMYCILHFI